jgi:Tfp pilus assembly protein PilX
MRRRFEREDGAAIVVAMLVMMIFAVTGLATLRFVDTQQRESGRERTRESSFALAEGALSAQIYTLSKADGWPANSERPYNSCTSAGGDDRCPTAGEVSDAFRTADYKRDAAWETEVHDNGRTLNEQCTTPPQPGSNFYDDVGTRAQPGWDANCDGFMWVRSSALVGGRERVLVALVKAEQLAADMPRYGVVAGSFQITTSGNHTYIDAGSPNQVIVRCPLSQTQCASYDAGSLQPPKPAQVDGQVVSDPAFQSGLSPETIDRLRATAKANGTYYASGCVPSLSGAMVFIEVANCSQGYNPIGNSSWNSPTNPGVLIIGEGTIELRGNSTFYGLIYHVNRSDEVAPDQTPNAPVVRIEGGTRVIGGVLIDGRGGLVVGSNNGGPSTQGNLVFDPRAFDAVKVYGTAGIVQNSFREIKPAAAAAAR